MSTATRPSTLLLLAKQATQIPALSRQAVLSQPVTTAQAFVAYRNLYKSAEGMDWGGMIGQAGDYLGKNPWAVGALGGAGVGALTGIGSGNMLRNAAIGAGIGGLGGLGYSGYKNYQANTAHEAQKALMRRGVNNQMAEDKKWEAESNKLMEQQAQEGQTARDNERERSSAEGYLKDIEAAQRGRDQQEAEDKKWEADSNKQMGEESAKQEAAYAHKQQMAQTAPLVQEAASMGLLGKDPASITQFSHPGNWREMRQLVEEANALYKTTIPNIEQYQGAIPGGAEELAKLPGDAASYIGGATDAAGEGLKNMGRDGMRRGEDAGSWASGAWDAGVNKVTGGTRSLFDSIGGLGGSSAPAPKPTAPGRAPGGPSPEADLLRRIRAAQGR